MDAWGQLVSGATIESGDAWALLQAQGGGELTHIVLADGLEVDIDMEDMVVSVEADQDFTVEVETQEFEIELDTNYIVEI